MKPDLIDVAGARAKTHFRTYHDKKLAIDMASPKYVEKIQALLDKYDSEKVKAEKLKAEKLKAEKLILSDTPQEFEIVEERRIDRGKNSKCIVS